jgi:formylglycine-generating enzyme required for sulfatase activity
MVGNVLEWTDSQYGEDTNLRVVRGASFVSDAGWLRAAVRPRLVPGSGLVLLGFRCVRE